MANDKYRLIDYFDVWGNKEDGWEVNNLCNSGEILLAEDATHKDIIQALIDVEFFKNTVTELDLDIWDDHYMIEFFERSNGKPLCRLELI